MGSYIITGSDVLPVAVTYIHRIKNEIEPSPCYQLVFQNYFFSRLLLKLFLKQSPSLKGKTEYGVTLPYIT